MQQLLVLTTYVACYNFYAGIFFLEGKPSLANDAPINQTYRTCQGAELNMTASFVSIPGPFISWFLLPNTNKYVHYHEGRGGGYTQIFYTTNYYIPVMNRHMFGTYLVKATNNRGVTKIYIQVLNSSCAGKRLYIFDIVKFLSTIFTNF